MKGRSSARSVNAEYYMADSPGRVDYWRLMAAPRARASAFLKFIDEYSPKSLVDLGCGSGWLLKEIGGIHPEISLCGIDFSAAQIDRNRREFPSLRWVVADLDREMSFGEASTEKFDAAIAAEIIEHVDDPVLFLKNALALVAKGGMLCLSTQSGRIWETERQVGHRRHFSVGEMRELMASSGWTAVRIWNEGYPFHDLSKFFANRNPRRTMEAYSRAPYGRRQRAVCRLLRLIYGFNSKRRGAQLFALARKDG